VLEDIRCQQDFFIPGWKRLKYVDFNRSVQFAGVSIKKLDLFRDKGIALKLYRGWE
jgi:hypothetical protein